MLALLLPLAHATPDLPFPRAEEPVRALRYLKVDGDGPAVAMWRRRSGPIEAWVFPDGTVEHYRRYDGKRLLEERAFDAAGRPLTAITYADGAPTQVTVTGLHPGEIDVSGWTPRVIGSAAVMLPTAEPHTWTAPGFELAVHELAVSGDPLSDGFRDGLAASCGCVLIDRTTTWIDGRTGARYRVQMPRPDGTWEGDLWAVAQGPGVLLVWSLADAAHADALAGGRAAVALMKWEPR